PLWILEQTPHYPCIVSDTGQFHGCSSLCQADIAAEEEIKDAKLYRRNLPGTDFSAQTPRWGLFGPGA
ncbi:MAG: hypothetical protein V7629_16110, partial [Motiliproteus sp.]